MHPEYDKLNPIETQEIQEDLAVERLRFSKGKMLLKYNDYLTLESIFSEMFMYQLESRFTVEW